MFDVFVFATLGWTTSVSHAYSSWHNALTFIRYCISTKEIVYIINCFFRLYCKIPSPNQHTSVIQGTVHMTEFGLISFVPICARTQTEHRQKTVPAKLTQKKNKNQWQQSESKQVIDLYSTCCAQWGISVRRDGGFGAESTQFNNRYNPSFREKHLNTCIYCICVTSKQHCLSLLNKTQDEKWGKLMFHPP